ncbi:MAG: hypothetical protein JNK72_16375 [Myxococcales bacterium]|nr:hypothetical protein [Myxococcales bacterium]
MPRWRCLKAAVALFVAGLGLRCEPSREAVAPARTVDATAPQPWLEAPLVDRQRELLRRFAMGYRPQCRPELPTGRRRLRRALVTAFGPYADVRDNASSAIVGMLVPGVAQALPLKPGPGVIEAPDARLAVASETVHLQHFGEARLCAMVLPSYWDLPGDLVLREIEAFQPDVVVMTGVSKRAREIILELGTVNESDELDDDSPAGFRLSPGRSLPVLDGPGQMQGERLPLVLSWSRVRRAMRRAWRAERDALEGPLRFDARVNDVRFGAYPRRLNRYLCNALAHAVNAGLAGQLEESHFARTLAALESPRETLGWPLPRVTPRPSLPRVFVHFPSELAGRHREAAEAMLVALLAAQLAALHDPVDAPVLSEGIAPDSVSAGP